jgi:DNA uptake protein ComE-like DNA-binding protein
MSRKKPAIDFVDINTASAEELAAVPHLSKTLAENIAAAKPYQKLEDLLNVRGVGQRLLDQLRPHLKVSPLDVNRVSADELAALPRFPRLLAERIAADRPFSRLEEVKKVRGMGPRLFEQFSPYLYAGPVDEAPPISQPEIEPAVPLPAAAAATPPLELEEKPSLHAAPPAAHPLPVIAVGPTTTTQAVFVPSEEPAPVEQAKPPVPPEQVVEKPAPGPSFFKQPGWSRAIQIIAPEASYAAGAGGQDAPRPRRSELLVWGGGIGLLVLFLSIAFSLGLMALINGGLRYAADRQVTEMQNKLLLLDSQAGTLLQDVEGLRTRLDGMEAFSGRMGALEEEQVTLAENLDTLDQQVQTFQQQLDDVSQQVADVQERTTAFEQFLDGLSNLLQEVWPGTP